MKRRVLLVLIGVFILLIGYYVVSNTDSAHPVLDVSDVQSITINNKTFKSDVNTKDITEFVKIYNKAKKFKEDYSTTPSYKILIDLKNGKKINVEGTTQGFHYVSKGEKSYKISSAELTYYLRDVMKD